MLLSMTLVGIGPVTCLGQVGEILRKIVGAELYYSNYVILACGHEAVHFVAGIGKDISFVKRICTISVLEGDLAFKNHDELSILMVMYRILPDVCYRNAKVT